MSTARPGPASLSIPESRDRSVNSSSYLPHSAAHAKPYQEVLATYKGIVLLWPFSLYRDKSAAEKRRQLIQESKFLGGDMEHTHLVKGLDFALLQKVSLCG